MNDEKRIGRTAARGLLVFACGLCLYLASPAYAQDQASDESSDQGTTELTDESGQASGDVGTQEANAEAATEEADLYSADELDALVAPYALYPDSLLTQVLMASTFPLEIVKAQRWVDDNEDLPDDQREDAAQQEDWDPSVAVLAAGFPTVIDRMSEDLDSTEDLGDALLAQSDDVLDAVQRQRARAQALGNLESNQAQTVEVSNDVITVQPADPQVVYVPTYDSNQVYTTQAPAQTVVQSDSGGSDTAALITTGLLSFGAGMLVAEIFDNNDPWDDYWRGGPNYWGGGGPNYVNWNNGNFYPRPGRNTYVNGDVNIDVNRNRFVNRDGAWQPDRQARTDARDRIRDRRDGGGTLDGRRSVGDRKATNLTSRDVSRNKLDQKLKARSGDGAAKLGKAGGKGTRSLEGSKRTSSSALKQNRGSGLTSTKKASQRGKASKSKTQRKSGAISRPKTSKKASIGGGGGTRKAGATKTRKTSALRKGSGSRTTKSRSRGSKSRQSGGSRRKGKR